MNFCTFSRTFENPNEFKNVNTAWLAFPILITNKAKFTRKEFQIFLEKEIFKQE